MGEARAKTLAELNGAPREVAVSPKDMVLMYLFDIACHTLGGIEAQLRVALGMPEAAAEVKKSIEHLAGYKTRHLQALSRKVVVAQPGDVPKVQ